MRPLIPSRASLGLSLVAAGLAAGLGLRAADPPKEAGGEPAAKPRLVTLKLDASLERVLDEIQQQTDVAVDRSRADVTRAVRIDCKDTPFWVALEQIAKASDHRIMFAEQGRTIQLVTGEGVTYRELPLALDGVFRLAARRVQAVYDVEADRSFYDVALALHWEPQFSAFLIDPPGKEVTAIDNNDKALTVAEAGRGRIAVSGGGTLLTLRLTDVPRASRIIKRLEGGLKVIGAPKMVRFEFDKLSREKQTKTEDGVKVTVNAAFEGDELWKARVEFEYPEGGPQLESFESGAWLSENQAFLLSTDNKRRLDVNGGSDYEAGTRRAVVNYHWVPPDTGSLGKAADWRLVVRTPSKLVEVPVKFKLENIPLP